MSAPTNPAFQVALQRHLDAWASDARSFTSEATPDDVLREVEAYDKANRDTSSRRYINRFSMLIQNFQGFFSAVDTFVSINPQTAALVWGGLRFVIQVREARLILLFPNPSYRSFPILHLTLNRSSTCLRQSARISTSITATQQNCTEILTG